MHQKRIGHSRTRYHAQAIQCKQDERTQPVARGGGESTKPKGRVRPRQRLHTCLPSPSAEQLVLLPRPRREGFVLLLLPSLILLLLPLPLLLVTAATANARISSFLNVAVRSSGLAAARFARDPLFPVALPRFSAALLLHYVAGGGGLGLLFECDVVETIARNLAKCPRSPRDLEGSCVCVQRCRGAPSLKKLSSVAATVPLASCLSTGRLSIPKLPSSRKQTETTNGRHRRSHPTLATLGPPTKNLSRKS